MSEEQQEAQLIINMWLMSAPKNKDQLWQHEEEELPAVSRCRLPPLSRSEPGAMLVFKLLLHLISN